LLILDALPLLVRVIQAPEAKTKENVNATENCISAVGKIMKFKPDCVNVEEVLPHWLSWLPLHEDKEEAVQTFSYLCDLIERYRPPSFLTRDQQHERESECVCVCVCVCGNHPDLLPCNPVKL
jgi:hypothetical protein